MREKTIERKLADAVRARGGLAPKSTSPGFDSMSDRIVLMPGGRRCLQVRRQRLPRELDVGHPELRDRNAAEVRGHRRRRQHEPAHQRQRHPDDPSVPRVGLLGGEDRLLRFDGVRYNLVEGRNRFAGLAVPPEGGRVYLYGKYTMDIEARGGSL